MNKKSIFGFLIVCLGFAACGSKAPQGVRINVPVMENSFEVVAGESALDTAVWNSFSPQKREVITAFFHSMADHLKFKEGAVVLDITPEAYSQIGLPDSLYLQLLRDVRANNAYCDSIKMSSTNRVKLFEQMVENFRRY